MAKTDENTNVNNNGENGAAGAPEKTDKNKVKFADRVKAALTKKREYSVLGIVKTVGFIVAIPIAVAVGKGIQRNEDEQLLNATLTDNNYVPEPQAALPGNTETEVQQEIIEPEYTEVE